MFFQIFSLFFGGISLFYTANILFKAHLHRLTIFCSRSSAGLRTMVECVTFVNATIASIICAVSSRHSKRSAWVVFITDVMKSHQQGGNVMCYVF